MAEFFSGRKEEKKRRKIGRFGGWKRRVSDRSVHICLFAFNLAKEERSDPPSVHKPINLSRNWVIVVVRYLIGPIFSPHRGRNIFASSPGTEDPIQFFQFLFVVEEKKEKISRWINKCAMIIINYSSYEERKERKNFGFLFLEKRFLL